MKNEFIQFEDDFRDILRASLRMYNGTDNAAARRSQDDGSELVKAAWDKLMIEVALSPVKY